MNRVTAARSSVGPTTTGGGDSTTDATTGAEAETVDMVVAGRLVRRCCVASKKRISGRGREAKGDSCVVPFAAAGADARTV